MNTLTRATSKQPVTLVEDARASGRIPNPLDFTIRLGIVSDSEELSKFWGPARRFSQLRLLRRYFEEVEQDVQAVHVAEYADRYVGQFWTRYKGIDPAIADSDTECYLHTLFVPKPYRRRGIARALTEAASEEARLRGRRTLIIGVDRPNEYALSLYEKWGFAEFYESSDLRGDLIFLRRDVF